MFCDENPLAPAGGFCPQSYPQLLLVSREAFCGQILSNFGEDFDARFRPFSARGLWYIRPMSRRPAIVQVAIPTPLRTHFDYLNPQDTSPPQPGVRVRVPFGRRQVVGIALGVVTDSAIAASRLKRVSEVLDREPVIPAAMLHLLTWAADYYHHPIGDVLHSALPVLLRRGQAPDPGGVTFWRRSAAGVAIAPEALARAPVQQKILAALGQAPAGLDADGLLAIADGWRRAVNALEARGWVEREQRDCLATPVVTPQAGPELNPAQQVACNEVIAGLGEFCCYLLHGVTGSGKTEVYLRATDAVLQQGGQILILVPEIGLTPQLVRRVQARFAVPLAVLHSGLSDRERLCAWYMAATGKAKIVLGTRSAVFTPLVRPGLFIVDEEHDGSYKQQDGFRYHARDVAIVRARNDGVPILLGSATPSLESFYNAQQGRYARLDLPARTGTAGMPGIHLLDMRKLPVEAAISRPLREAIQTRLARGEQSLLFLNRRGFAPVMMCYDCGWIAPCPRCDTRLTLHKATHRLRCHHCGTEQARPARCPDCGADTLHGIGEGTERVEEILRKWFPDARSVRIDRDTTRQKGALADLLQQARAGEADILIGTQMLSKGHHFPNVTLVGVLNADQGLYSLDFRSAEYLFQQVSQVAGRAGRGDKAGQVLIQTYHPDSPYFAALAQHDYAQFAEFACAERRESGLPPFGYLALLRAEATARGQALAFLDTARRLAEIESAAGVELLGPAPAPMERRAGRYRAQLLLRAGERAVLHRFIGPWLTRIGEIRAARAVRWSIDIDPTDLQ